MVMRMGMVIGLEILIMIGDIKFVIVIVIVTVIAVIIVIPMSEHVQHNFIPGMKLCTMILFLE